MDINLHNFGPRNYDPALGRWQSIDPLAEQAPGWSPYRFGYDSPMNYNDPSGMSEDAAITDVYDYSSIGPGGPKDGDHGKVVNRDGAAKTCTHADGYSHTWGGGSSGGDGSGGGSKGGSGGKDFAFESIGGNSSSGGLSGSNLSTNNGGGDNNLKTIQAGQNTPGRTYQVSAGQPSFWDNEKSMADDAFSRGDVGPSIAYSMLDDAYLSYNWIVHKESTDLRGYNVGANKAINTSVLTVMTAAYGYLAKGIVALKTVKGGLTNAQLVQKAATKAEAAIGGTGRYAGTAKHNYATDLLERYQSIYGNKGLQFKVPFNNGPGNRGVLDALDNVNGIIYDWKFGYPDMTPGQLNMTKQMLKYQRNFGLPTQIIKP